MYIIINRQRHQGSENLDAAPVSAWRETRVAVVSLSYFTPLFLRRVKCHGILTSNVVTGEDERFVLI